MLVNFDSKFLGLAQRWPHVSPAAGPETVLVLVLVHSVSKRFNGDIIRVTSRFTSSRR